MKKLIVSFIIVVLLAACQSANTPTSEPPTAIPQPLPSPTPATVEEPVTTEAQLYGIWYFRGGENYFMEITSSEIRMYAGLGNQFDTVTYSFDAGKLTFKQGNFCKDATATYEITLISHDGSVAAMRPTLIGDDACTDRKITFAGKTYKRVGP